jgi:MSHA pilin protein MshA
MMQRTNGFTLIELIAVILILGILAVTAAPQFLDLSASARTAAVAGVAGSLGSASSMNYARRSLVSTDGFAIGNCTAVSQALAGGSSALPTGYSITAAGVSAGGSTICTLVGPNGVTASFVALGI